MRHLKAAKAGVNQCIKAIAGLPESRLIRSSWELSTEAFWEYQNEAFRGIYQFACARTPYYRRRPDLYLPVPDGRERVLEFLRELPILEKPTVRKLNREFWASPRKPLTRFHNTSGTTGTPIRLSATLRERGIWQGILDDWMRRLCGSAAPTTLALTGFVPPSDGPDLYWWDPLMRRAFLSMYVLHPRNRDRIVDLIHRLEPGCIYGYPSAIHQLALLLDETKVQETRDQRFGVLTSEVLPPDWRHAIQNSLCETVYDMYGSQEGCHMVIECSHGGRHIHPMVGIVEIVDDHGRPAAPGTLGRVLVTGLIRRSMPLIRYEIGDSAVSTAYAADCPCGLKWPTIGTVAGRSDDLVRTRDGRRLGMLYYQVTKDLLGIKEVQIVQRDYEQFLCRLVPGESEAVNREQVETWIRSVLCSRLQSKLRVDFCYVNTIPRGPNGKFKAVVVDFR